MLNYTLTNQFNQITNEKRKLCFVTRVRETFENTQHGAVELLMSYRHFRCVHYKPEFSNQKDSVTRITSAQKHIYGNGNLQEVVHFNKITLPVQ